MNKFRVWSLNQKCWKNNCFLGSDGILYAISLYTLALEQAPDDFIIQLNTGSKDSDDKDIYEGDIVLHNGKKYTIKYAKAYSGYMYCMMDGNEPDNFYGGIPDFDIHVTGHIYD